MCLPGTSRNINQMTAIYHINNFNEHTGGVENLVKDLTEILSLNCCPWVYFYSEENNEEKPRLENLICITRKAYSKLSIIKYFLLFWYVFKRREKTLIVFDVAPLVFFAIFRPDIQIILIQTNKWDRVLRNKMRRWILIAVRKKLLITCYTTDDKKKLLTKIHTSELHVEIIPRACRLQTSNCAKEQFTGSLVTIARLDEKQKNFTKLIDLVKKLDPSFKLDIYGVGNVQEVRALKNKLKGLDNIRFCGEAKNISKVLKNYELFLMTSNYEGFGQTIIEANSQGLPVILYNNFEAAKNIICNGQNGFLIDKNDDSSYIDAILSFCKNPSQLKRMSIKCLELSSRYEKVKINNLWVKVLLKTAR